MGSQQSQKRKEKKQNRHLAFDEAEMHVLALSIIGISDLRCPVLQNLDFNIHALKVTNWEAGWQIGPWDRRSRQSGRAHGAFAKSLTSVPHPPGPNWSNKDHWNAFISILQTSPIMTFQGRKGIEIWVYFHGASKAPTASFCTREQAFSVCF